MPVKKKYRDFEEARAFVRSLGLKDSYEWFEWARGPGKPEDIPTKPDSVVAYKGRWRGYADWLGTRKKLALLVAATMMLASMLAFASVASAATYHSATATATASAGRGSPGRTALIIRAAPTPRGCPRCRGTKRRVPLSPCSGSCPRPSL